MSSEFPPNASLMESDCAPPPRTYVEIGCGQTIGYTKAMRFNPDDQYVGIENGYIHDKDPSLSVAPLEGFSLIEATVENSFRHPPRLRFAVCDGAHTRLEDGMADEVLLANVLTDPFLVPWIFPGNANTDIIQASLLRSADGRPEEIVVDDLGKNRTFYLEDSLGDKREALLCEAARITKATGRIVINSYLTPEFLRHDRVGHFLQQYGFEAEVLNPKDSIWHEKTAGYRETKNPSGAHRFVIATRPHPAAE
ncbi:MAG TPA: hypothetical protein VLG16_01025 [Candidatus Saccharimonadales bacterium]|nr:hypothetical protein [Candidatus Saccharimonadales bacterium]